MREKLREANLEKVRLILCEYEGGNPDQPACYLELAGYILQELDISFLEPQPKD